MTDEDFATPSFTPVGPGTYARFMAVRVTSDDLRADLPPEVLSLTGNTGAIRWGATLGALWKRPASVGDMWKMWERSNQAAEKLADFLDGVLAQLPIDD